MQFTKRKRSLESIEALRLIAALGVMLSHVGYGYYYAKGFSSSVGVNLFFCISAFLMMFTTEQSMPKHFVVKRIIRLAPLYWLLTILTFAASYFVSKFGQANISVDELIKSLLFLPYARDGLKDADVVRPIVGPAWTMNCDIWFMVIFAISAKLNYKNRGIIAASLCLLIRITGAFLPGKWAISDFMHRQVWINYAAGILVYYVWSFVRSIDPKGKTLWATAVLLLTVLLYFMAKPAYITTFLCATILFVVLFAFQRTHMPRAVTWFGTISYSFYLVHYYVIMILSIVFDFTKFSHHTVIGTILALLISLVVAQLSYYIIERKFGDILRRKLLK